MKKTLLNVTGTSLPLDVDHDGSDDATSDFRMRFGWKLESHLVIKVKRPGLGFATVSISTCPNVATAAAKYNNNSSFVQ